MKKYPSNRFACLFFFMILFYISACTKSENVKADQAKPEKDLSDKQTSGAFSRIKVIHLYSDTVYILKDDFVREAGEQLIIDEGTVIKGVYINIKPGGIIIANGTKERPIIFTSRSLPGTQTTDLRAGIRIQGRSSDNSSTATYDAADLSGTLKYVRIEFAPLILQSVGNRTVLENIMVSYSGPASSFELRGGTVNAKNLISYACGGPADFYVTQGYSGSLQRLLAYRHPFFGTNTQSPADALAGMFIENNADASISHTAIPVTFPVISNLTVLGPDGRNGTLPVYSDTTGSVRSAALITTAGASFRIRNSVLSGFPAAAWYLDDSVTASKVLKKESEFSSSYVQSNFHNRVFYLKPGGFPPYTSADFNSFMMNPLFKNRILLNSADLLLNDPFNYNAPALLPRNDSPLLSGADFSGTDYETYFEKVSYTGAAGTDNWLSGWTNFTPLRTNYNFPE